MTFDLLVYAAFCCDASVCSGVCVCVGVKALCGWGVVVAVNNASTVSEIFHGVSIGRKSRLAMASAFWK